MTRKLTTTSFTLLGLLALRSWTAYEMTQQMQRALRWVWLRSEAGLYAELRRLDEIGLARAVNENVGARIRARYHITDEGRAAVRRWLTDSEPVPPHVQIEEVLRVFLADLGSVDDLRRSLDATRRQVAESLEQALPVFEDYVGPDAPFPERAHLNVLFIRFMVGFDAHVLKWCDEVEAELDTWNDTAGVGPTPGTTRMMEEALTFARDTIDERLDEPEEGTA